MQAGTTGINIPRVYNPVKQAHDHDPRGIFVRRWLPAMRNVPDLFLFEPWTMPADVQNACGVVLGKDIPLPVVELDTATREAKAKLFAVRGKSEVKAQRGGIAQRHGSRKNLAQKKSLKKRNEGSAILEYADNSTQQTKFDF